LQWQHNYTILYIITLSFLKPVVKDWTGKDWFTLLYKERRALLIFLSPCLRRNHIWQILCLHRIHRIHLTIWLCQQHKNSQSIYTGIGKIFIRRWVKMIDKNSIPTNVLAYRGVILICPSVSYLVDRWSASVDRTPIGSTGHVSISLHSFIEVYQLCAFMGHSRAFTYTRMDMTNIMIHYILFIINYLHVIRPHGYWWLRIKESWKLFGLLAGIDIREKSD
jgi:hypothetical protein